MTTPERIEQRMKKLQKLGAGDQQCLDCLNISIDEISVCKKCISDTPEFNRIIKSILSKDRTK